MYSQFFEKAPTFNFIKSLLELTPINDNLTRIYSHSFNRQLFDGILSAQIFGKYLHDDYIYLHHYALTLLQLSLHINSANSSLAQLLHHLATEIISGEQAMQEQYKEYFTHEKDAKPERAISQYIDFLNSKTQEEEELSVALCSILPCFWIYSELGKRAPSPDSLLNNPYKNWIDTYTDQTFKNATMLLVAFINQLAEQSNLSTRIKMQEAFSQAVALELNFFDEVHPEVIYEFAPAY